MKRSNLIMLLIMVGPASVAITYGLLAPGDMRLPLMPPPVQEQSFSGPPAPAQLAAISPRLISNQTSYPVTLSGASLPQGSTLRIEGAELDLPTHFVDGGQLTARIPAGIAVPSNRPAQPYRVYLVAPTGERIFGNAELTIVNDAAYPVPMALAVDPASGRPYAATPSTDQVWTLGDDGAPRAIEVGDGPRDLASYLDGQGRSHLLVLHEWDGSLWDMLLEGGTESVERRIQTGTMARRMLVDAAGDRVFVAGVVDERVRAYRLSTGESIAEYGAGVDPAPMALAGAVLAVGNQGSSDISLLPLSGEGEGRRVAPAPGMPILGGHTAPFSDRIMGGKAARDLAYSPALDLIFVASVGPNIGPNEKRMEVSHNGGISVLRPDGTYLRHVSMLRGIPQALALDEARRLLYVADVSAGRVVVFDAAALGDETRADKSLLAALPMEPPADTALIRRAEEFGVKGRNGANLHSGPWDLALSEDGQTLQVLNRLTGTLARLDVSGAAEGRLLVTEQRPLVPRIALRQRQLGEVIFFSDLANSRMSCDGCHMEGHNEGLLFTKGEPMHIYRTPTLRWIRESPPYFTPAMFPTLQFVSEFVLSRNRFHNPDASQHEVAALALYQASITGPPNPYRGDTGELAETITLPDGRHGDPKRGGVLFRGPGECGICHPAPMFTTDQKQSTRRRAQDVGTDVTLPLRKELQDADNYPLPPPALVGVWDNFPLLHSGAAGYSVSKDQRALASHPFALRRLFQLGRESRKHGAMAHLTPKQEDDVIAYLLSL